MDKELHEGGTVAGRAPLTGRLRAGRVFETVFRVNRKGDSRYRLRATHANGRRAPKAILSSDGRITPGQPCRVRIVSVSRPDTDGRGHVEVEYVGPAALRLDGDHWLDRTVAMKLQAMLENGMNVLLDGPPGSGKNTLSEALARALGMEFVFFNCSACYEATDFLASFQLRASESGQVETAWIPTDILRALEAATKAPERRFLVYLDEASRCRPAALNGIMPALDATRRLFNPITGSTVAIPPNVQWIAAVNLGHEFTGTASVDPAHLDRFAPLKIDYPPPKEERRILAGRHPSLRAREIARVVALAHAVRSDRNLRLDLSMRATEELCTLLEHPNFRAFDGDAVAELARTSFCGRFAGSWDDPATDAGLAWRAIAAALEKEGRP